MTSEFFFVPIRAPNQQYEASGWLGIRIAEQNYVHFRKEVFVDAFTGIVSMLITDQKDTKIIIQNKSKKVK